MGSFGHAPNDGADANVAREGASSSYGTSTAGPCVADDDAPTHAKDPNHNIAKQIRGGALRRFLSRKLKCRVNQGHGTEVKSE